MLLFSSDASDSVCGVAKIYPHWSTRLVRRTLGQNKRDNRQDDLGTTCNDNVHTVEASFTATTHKVSGCQSSSILQSRSVTIV